jgi:two-component system response regulator AtoC
MGDAVSTTAQAIPEAVSLRRVVIVETDPGVQWSLKKGLERSGYEVEAVATLSAALRVLEAGPAAVVVMELAPEAGLDYEALSALIETAGSPQVVCVSVDSSPAVVVECMRRGAGDFLLKPFGLAEMRGVINRSLQRRPPKSVLESGSLSEDPEGGPSLLVGISQAIQDLRKLVLRAARTDLNCLIRGESGVGKDIVARELHRLSKRRDKPFVKVNCTALPENLLESELFGYEKGAFTGADSAKPGLFQMADGGIIFLDEIGDMHPYVQAKILQVIEHKEFTKLGGSKSVKVDVQIVTATNADLEQKLARGQFRNDLYFRLNEVYIMVPPLAERKEDVPLLIHHFLGKHDQYGDGSTGELSSDDSARLSAYDWPGNVRELESTIKRWLALGKSSSVLPGAPPPSRAVEPSTTPGKPTSRKAVNKVELTSEMVLEALQDHTWNRRKAAEALGVSYSAIRRFIDKHELTNQR